MKMTAKEMETVLTLIGKADFDQIVKVAERVKLQRDFVQNQNRRTLVIGDTVEFVARGVLINGEVTKINRKTVMVRQATRNNTITNWKVPAEMLKKVA
jgi:hypothetical protein